MDDSVVSKVGERFSRKIHEASVKDLAGMLILNTIKESASPMSAYDLIGLIHLKYGVLLGSGMVYPILSSFERDELTETKLHKSPRKKKVYTITSKGDAVLQLMKACYQNILKDL
jgi:DNA-binding PadR family transcriptional regulator